MGLRVETTWSPGFLVESLRRALESMSNSNRLRSPQVTGVYCKDTWGEWPGWATSSSQPRAAPDSRSRSSTFCPCPRLAPSRLPASGILLAICLMSRGPCLPSGRPWLLCPSVSISSSSLPVLTRWGADTLGLGGLGPQQAYLLGCWLAPGGLRGLTH